MGMNKQKSIVDKIILTLLGLEYIGFGLLGLIDPISVSTMVGFGLNELISFSELKRFFKFSSVFIFPLLSMFGIHVDSDLGVLVPPAGIINFP